MKRSAAILGPTPPFLRWTIVLPCQFRETDARNPANAAFRDLRSLRAIAVGEIDNRIIDGICIHPNATNVSLDEAKGFPLEEIFAAYGGKENAAKACRSCPANVPVCHSELEGGCKSSKAGCFGWLPFESDGSEASGFMGLMESGNFESESLIENFETAMSSMAQQSPFPQTTPAWFGVWSQQSFTVVQLAFLNAVCEKVESDSIAWKRLARAIQVSHKHDLDLRVELTPAGFSDGLEWAIEASCASCGVGSPKMPCEVCGSQAAPRRERKTKVLGLRPYLNLVSIVGPEETQRLLTEFEHKQFL